MERKIGTSTRATTEMTSLNQYVGATLDFDQMGVSGSLGDKIQIGGNNIIIDGSNRRIILNDGNVDRIIIGELE
jgi:hypothetical protein